MSTYEGSPEGFADAPAASSGEKTQPLPAVEPPADAASPMQTAVRRFSRRFVAEIAPLLGPIQQATASLGQTTLPPRLRGILPTLRDLHHQVQMLVDKVERQQAYVLIFGPLKSGKSTFMNALCSTYVSEVTSLPAYPCIVSVSHGQTPSSAVTRYDGSSQTFASQQALYDMVVRAHGELMGRVREVEGQGEDFEPAQHMPAAIRRIDVKLPTPVLADSGAVLVDTPGLYSRMKFGYDRMTRDFRHAAACAIFVVKTDNLFLEQVFNEFNELLEMFSRIFLVVNLDLTKRDLSCDGRLVPSLEQANPEAIIQAFRDLTMSAPLKAAADQGRLHIFPVDLLGSASRRIRSAAGAVDDADEQWLDEHEDSERFDRLMGELTRYLNSSEYLREFLSDSLRRAGLLADELGDLVEHEALRDLSAQMTALRDEHRHAKARVEAVERLKAIDLAHQAQALQESLLAGAVRQAQEIRDQVTQALVQIVDGWFQDDSSLKQLREGRLEPLLNDARQRISQYLADELQRQAGNPCGGLSLNPQAREDLDSLDLDLAALAADVLRQGLGEADAPAFRSNLETDEIPVRKTFWDYLFFRSRSSIRARLLGPADNPARPLASDAKSSRLGEPARKKMNELAVNQLETMLEAASRYRPEEVVHAYAHRLAERVNQRLAELHGQMQARMNDLAKTLAEVQHVLSDVHALDEQVQQAEQALRELREEFLSPPAVPMAPAGCDVTPGAATGEPVESVAPAGPEEPAGPSTLEPEPPAVLPAGLTEVNQQEPAPLELAEVVLTPQQAEEEQDFLLSPTASQDARPEFSAVEPVVEEDAGQPGRDEDDEPIPEFKDEDAPPADANDPLADELERLARSGRYTSDKPAETTEPDSIPLDLEDEDNRADQAR